ncbi:Rieske (2Fe-2S) protein [Gilvimarinus polysaccharolyticus]|uniref:Rieske (2Fe-2S) protein n=1 Tax=Gilvimarinus polysaccharolyticus TaxID=863921 RepID=UPI0006737ABB|nr:Rieske 2Fe-2S domain-containing protein [Gilvimarinus polysaccharolyticus]
MSAQQHYLCQLTELADNSSRGFTLTTADMSVFAVRRGEQIFVYRNLCPHVQIPLEWVEHEFLTADNSLIQCANHGALFTIDTGHCIAGPCSGQSLLPINHTISNGALYAILDEPF